MNFIRSVVVNMGFLGLKRHYIAVEISLGAISKISEKSNLIILLQVIKPLSLTKTSRFFAVNWNGISSTWWPQSFCADGKLWLAVLSLIKKTWVSKWIITQAMAGCSIESLKTKSQLGKIINWLLRSGLRSPVIMHAKGLKQASRWTMTWFKIQVKFLFSVIATEIAIVMESVTGHNTGTFHVWSFLLFFPWTCGEDTLMTVSWLGLP